MWVSFWEDSPSSPSPCLPPTHQPSALGSLPAPAVPAPPPHPGGARFRLVVAFLQWRCGVLDQSQVPCFLRQQPVLTSFRIPWVSLRSSSQTPLLRMFLKWSYFPEPRWLSLALTWHFLRVNQGSTRGAESAGNVHVQRSIVRSWLT